MKDILVLDFDDVLFNNTTQFKVHMFGTIAEVSGIPEAELKKEYEKVREHEFSLREFLVSVFLHQGKDMVFIENLYEVIMRRSKEFVNIELVEMLPKIGLNNCYIVTYGDPEFQKDKIKYSGMGDLFDESKIRYVTKSKKDAIFQICRENRGRRVRFIDDKPKFIDELKSEDRPENLETVLFVPGNLKVIFKEPSRELRKPK